MLFSLYVLNVLEHLQSSRIYPKKIVNRDENCTKPCLVSLEVQFYSPPPPPMVGLWWILDVLFQRF